MLLQCTHAEVRYGLEAEEDARYKMYMYCTLHIFFTSVIMTGAYICLKINCFLILLRLPWFHSPSWASRTFQHVWQNSSYCPSYSLSCQKICKINMCMKEWERGREGRGRGEREEGERGSERGRGRGKREWERGRGRKRERGYRQ